MISNREKFKNILDMKSDSCGFWHGSPIPESSIIFNKYFNAADDFELGLKLHDTMRWILAGRYIDWDFEGLPFDVMKKMKVKDHSSVGVFADCTDVSELSNHHWPYTANCSLIRLEQEIDKTIAAGQGVACSMISLFFHAVADLFGMENYFVKMYTDPDIVEAVTERVMDFYLSADELIFSKYADKIDTSFYFNDFGSQQDIMISPEMFDRFVLPYVKELVNLSHKHKIKTIWHSCGAIDKLIPRLIDAKIDILHPIQAKAVGMEAKSLQRKYGDKLIFMGGVDTQDLLPFGTPSDVRKEVARLKSIFGPNYIVSPSHEALLPIVPPENVLAMVEATFD